MKRLTKRTTNCPLPVLVRDRAFGPAYFVSEEDYTDYRDALEKLARYEDTGLEPEEMRELLHDSTGPLHKKLGEWIDAEQEGRLLVLPCKVGDTVWLIVQGMSSPMPVPVCSLTWRDGKWSINADREETEPPKVVNFQIGKTAYLTREDAEKALGGGTNDKP